MTRHQKELSSAIRMCVCIGSEYEKSGINKLEMYAIICVLDSIHSRPKIKWSSASFSHCFVSADQKRSYVFQTSLILIKCTNSYK